MKVFGTHQENTLEQIRDVDSRAHRTALMADGHFGYVMPIGGVAAYQDRVSVVGVGVDIACGNAAIQTDLTLEALCGLTPDDVRANPHRLTTNPIMRQIADEIYGVIAFGPGKNNEDRDAPTDHSLFYDHRWNLIPGTGGFRDELRLKARRQLGTIGGGNHYVDVFYDHLGYIWVGVHFGSRAFGFTIAKNFIAISQGGSWGDKYPEKEALMDTTQQDGQDYWGLMELAGEYAYAGREWAARRVVQILGGLEVDLVHNHHNFAWKETHDQRELVVVRKGATPAWPGQRGFVGGSMGDDSVILQGTLSSTLGTSGEDLAKAQEDALYSTVHGAGRVMGRNEAKGRWKKGVLTKRGRVTAPMMNDWLDKVGVVLRGGDLDEAPQVYRRLDDVLGAQGDTVQVLNTLTPAIVCMAPSRTGLKARF